MMILKSELHRALLIFHIIGVLLLSSTPVLSSQNGNCIIVTDSLTKQRLQFATVTIASGKKEIKKRTNYHGIVKYRSSGSCIAVSATYIGYKQKSIPCTEADTIFVVLAKQDNFMDEVVVTGNFTPTLQNESLFSIKVIDREKIDAQQGNTVRDILQWENNIRLSQDNILGSSVSLQGISGQNVKFLIDGVPVIGRLNGNIDVSQILLNDVERIELIQGPMSVQYGTDALGGVINIITKTNSASALKTNANTYYESVGTYNADIDIEKTFDDFGARVSFGRYFFGGYNSDGLDESVRASQWKPREQYFTSWQLRNNFDGLSLRYDGRYFNELILNRGEPQLPYKERAFDETYKTSRFNHTLMADIDLDTSSKLSVTSNISQYEREKKRFVKNLFTLENAQTTEPSDHDTSIFNSWMIRAVYNNTLQSGQLQFGLDVNNDENKGKKTIEGAQSISDYAAFGSFTTQVFDIITVQPGLRISHNTRYAAPIIPSMNVKFDFGDDISARFSYARGFRTPSLRELGFYFVDINHNIQGNTALSAEKSDNFQLALSSLHSFDKTIIKPNISFFYNDIRNLITLAQVSDVLYSYVNIGRFRSLGFNATAECITEKLRLSAAYGVTGRYNELSENFDIPQYYFSHDMQASAQYDNLLTDITPVINVKYNGSVRNIRLSEDNTMTTGLIDGYLMIDFIVKHKIFSPLLDISYGVKNLLNVQNINATTSAGTAHTSSISQQPIAFGRLFSLDCSLRMEW